MTVISYTRKIRSETFAFAAESAVVIRGAIPQTIARSTEHFWYERKFPRGDCTKKPQGSPSFFSLEAIDINGKMRSFDEFSGKVCHILVGVSRCRRMGSRLSLSLSLSHTHTHTHTLSLPLFATKRIEKYGSSQNLSVCQMCMCW